MVRPEIETDLISVFVVHCSVEGWVETGDAAFVTDLFEFVLDLAISFAQAQLQAGADIIEVGAFRREEQSADRFWGLREMRLRLLALSEFARNSGAIGPY